MDNTALPLPGRTERFFIPSVDKPEERPRFDSNRLNGKAEKSLLLPGGSLRDAFP